MKKNVLLLMMSVFSIATYAQNFQWAKQFEEPINDENGQAIAVDASGNVYTTGYFKIEADFDPGAGTYRLKSQGAEDIYITKLDASGNFVWAKNIGSKNADQGFGIALDASGNVYTTGTFQGTVDFDPGAGIQELTSSTSTLGDIFILKLDPSGNFVWAKSIGSPDGDVGYTISIDPSGNVITSGIFIGTADFDPGAGTFNMTSSGSNKNPEIFILKLDSKGDFVWAKRFGNIYNEQVYSIDVDAAGNIYAVGYFSAGTDFDPNDGTQVLNPAGEDIFVLKLDANGNYVWAKSMGGKGGDRAVSVGVDLKGNVYSTGYFYTSGDFDPGAATYTLTATADGNYEYYISKLDKDGNFIWAKNLPGWASDKSGFSTVDTAGNIYTTGTYSNSVDIDPGAASFQISSNNGSNDIFILKLNSSGEFQFASSLGGPKTDMLSAITVDDSQNIYATGYFGGAADFDPGNGTKILEAPYTNDIFVVKLGPGVLGIKEKLIERNLLVYPNPSNGSFSVDLGVQEENIKIELIDQLGRIVYQSNGNKGVVRLNESFKGIYVLKMMNTDGFYKTSRVLIE